MENIIVKKLKEKFEPYIEEIKEWRGELTIKVKKFKIFEICKFLHDDKDLDFDYLSNVCGVDYYPKKPRFEVVYHLYSIKKNHRVRIKVSVDESDLTVDSVTDIWGSANWHEREIYDMFGIKFLNHPDLRRILMPDEWEGHPLRKDYPLEGYD